MVVSIATVVMMFPSAVGAGSLPPGGTFFDDNGNIHEGNIEAIAAAGITRGCNPPTNNRYCPSAAGRDDPHLVWRNPTVHGLNDGWAILGSNQ